MSDSKKFNAGNGISQIFDQKNQPSQTTDFRAPRTVTVSSEFVGLRLDKFLSHIEEIHSRARAMQLIEKNLVLVNGKRQKPSYEIKATDEIAYTLPEPIPSGLSALDLPLHILFEDEDLLVVNKPSGLVVHPAAGHAQDTLVNALLHHTKNLSMKFGEDRPGIVHRIDKETSGLLVVAKNDFTHEGLAQQFKAKTTHRVYYALACGTPATRSSKIQTYLARHPVHRKRYASIKDAAGQTIRSVQIEGPEVGKWAITNFEILASRGALHYIKLKLETGRTHQIRVHLSEMNIPIVGDELYGFQKKIKSIASAEIQNEMKHLNRFFLHAAELGFTHPRTQKELSFQCDWPKEELASLKRWGFP